MSTINTIREKKAYSNFRHNRMAAILKMAAKGEWGKISRESLSKIAQNTLLYMCTNFGAFMKKWTIHLKYQSMLHYATLIGLYGKVYLLSPEYPIRIFCIYSSFIFWKVLWSLHVSVNTIRNLYIYQT